MTIKEVDLVALVTALGSLVTAIGIAANIFLGHRRGKEAKRDVRENTAQIASLRTAVNGGRAKLLKSNAKKARELADHTKQPHHEMEAQEAERMLEMYEAEQSELAD